MRTPLSEIDFWVVFALLLQRVFSTGDFQHLGCFRDSRLSRSLPRHFWIDVTLATPQQIIQKCADKAKPKGYMVFGLQNGYECWSGPDGERTYKRNGPASHCTKGLGGVWALDVYRFKVCRQLLFNGDTVQNKIVFNHSIAEHFVNSDDQCRIQCFMNHDCVSYNIGDSPTPGILLCELNNADRYQHPQDYQDKPGFSYVGTKNMCDTNPCKNGATCKGMGYGDQGFRCECPIGFYGVHCRK